jgi:hypothetical protein
MVLVPLNVLLLTLYENVGGNRVNDDGLSPAKKQKKILFFSAWLMCMILCYICYIYAPFLKVKIAQWVFTSISTTDIRQPDSVEYITFKLKCVLFGYGLELVGSNVLSYHTFYTDFSLL